MSRVQVGTNDIGVKKGHFAWSEQHWDFAERICGIDFGIAYQRTRFLMHNLDVIGNNIE